MIIAISSQGPTLDHAVDPRFGRAAGFILFDTESREHRWLENTANASQAQGAGIQTAQAVAESGASLVLTGRVGPKAEAALQQGNVRIAFCAEGTVRQALEQFEKGGSQAAAPAQGMTAGPAGPSGQGMGGCGRGMGGGGGRGMGGGGGRGMGGGGGRGMGGGGGRGMGGGGGRGMGGGGGRGMGGGGMGNR
ncbi:Predicted Fe-Mo cluster-binding protein, NifX family [Paucidesulfovibrio gracilis DSM 16080]|uniref:Predicted Fe-Mo cluster-binding protein, NifX family n=1 Tax=Paucidesulfovibrio gracilis DSM 16080 TaxID=1121449 RepID=A0A1T4Y4G9_9BACT|nr:NifB/NifX family molybdenum-iron cluster-binding protein [Paucidesulfovibrio gracilis]SKA96211.1 Predicted Fe-Mo cluster-binding protein, NifX family [Paucidesulfovibrio gracilis DSM 16080]